MLFSQADIFVLFSAIPKTSKCITASPSKISSFSKLFAQLLRANLDIGNIITSKTTSLTSWDFHYVGELVNYLRDRVVGILQRIRIHRTGR